MRFWWLVELSFVLSNSGASCINSKVGFHFFIFLKIQSCPYAVLFFFANILFFWFLLRFGQWFFPADVLAPIIWRKKNPQWRAWSPRDAAVIQNEQYIMIFGAIWSRKFSILINYISYILLDLPDFLNLTALFGLIASSQTFPPQQHWSLILRKCWSWLQLPGVLQGQILIELAFCKRCLLQEIIRVLA